jgi:hypothetical protein
VVASPIKEHERVVSSLLNRLKIIGGEGVRVRVDVYKGIAKGTHTVHEE